MLVALCSCGATWHAVEYTNGLAITKSLITHWASGHTVKAVKDVAGKIHHLAQMLSAINYAPKTL